MARRFTELPLHKRLQVRAAARRAWIQSKGHADAALLILKHDMDLEIDPVLVQLIIQIAMALFVYWFLSETHDPDVSPDSAEPVNWEHSDGTD